MVDFFKYEVTIKLARIALLYKHEPPIVSLFMKAVVQELGNYSSCLRFSVSSLL